MVPIQMVFLKKVLAYHYVNKNTFTAYIIATKLKPTKNIVPVKYIKPFTNPGNIFTSVNIIDNTINANTKDTTDIVCPLS